MIRLPPRSIRTYTLFPYTTPVRAIVKCAEPDGGPGAGAADELAALLDRADRFSFVGNGRAGKNRQAKGCADCMLDRHHRQFPSCFPVRRSRVDRGAGPSPAPFQTVAALRSGDRKSVV